MTYIWKQKKWPRLKWQNDKLISVLSRVRFLQGDLLSKVRSLGLDLSKEPISEVLVEETVKTAAIEGVQLDKDAVRSSIARRLGLPAAGLRAPDRDIEGLVDVLLDATTNYKKPLTCLLYTSPSPRDGLLSRMPSSA